MILHACLVRAKTLDSLDAVLGAEKASSDDRVVDEPAARSELVSERGGRRMSGGKSLLEGGARDDRDETRYKEDDLVRVELC